VPLHAVAEFGVARRDVSTAFFVGRVVFAVPSALAGPLVSRLGPARAAGLSLAVQTVALLVLAGSGVFGLFGAAFVLLMLVQPVVYVAARTGIAGVSAGRQGRAFGWFGLVSDLGWVIGPVAAGAMLPRLGGGVFVVLAAATGVAVGVALFRRVRAPTRARDLASIT
jgi:MFS family permease